MLDNQCNSSAESLARGARVCGRVPIFIKGDIRDAGLLETLFADHSIVAVLHCVGVKAVGESPHNLAASDPRRGIGLLCYFTPVGAHDNGLIGEDPCSIPGNLLPFTGQVAIGRRQELAVFGRNYSTRDGIGMRDYRHLADLAEGQLKAPQAIGGGAGLKVWSLGAGRGYSILEMIRALA